MSSKFQITVNDGHGLHRATLIEDSAAANSVMFGGRRYMVIAEQKELTVILDTLNALYPGAVTSAEPLPGRVSKIEARLIPSVWVQRDNAYLADLRHRVAETYLAQSTLSRQDFQDFLLQDAFPKSTVARFEECFTQAIDSKNIELLIPLLEHVPEYGLSMLVRGEKWNIPIREGEPCNQFHFTQESLQELQEYVQDPIVGFSGVITLQDSDGTYTIASEEIDPKTPFAVHSVSKVCTGMLLLRLLYERAINATVLDEPIQLAPSVVSALPETVQIYLKEQKPTLKQLMIHRGGLDNYLDKYIGAIDDALRSESGLPQINSLEDFLRYAEEKTYPLGEKNYSNLGLLLVGLSIQHLTQIPFDTLLHTYVVNPSGMNCFDSQKPHGAKVNQNDPIAEHLCGSPAGGYWTTAEDLCKFGSWAIQQCKDPAFMRLINEYGEEFYSQGEIRHDGIIPSSTANLSAFLEHGVTVAIVSDRNPGAPQMDEAIRNHMLHTRS